MYYVTERLVIAGLVTTALLGDLEDLHQNQF